MSKLKETNIKWIGNIPSNWRVTKIKYVSKLSGRIGWQGLTSNEYKDEGPYLITGTDFKDGTINFENAVRVDYSRWEEAKQIQVENGDLLITKDGTIGKVAIISGLHEKSSLNSGVLRIKTDDSVNKKFLYYVLLSEEFWAWFNFTNSGASTILHLYQNVFDNFSFALPPLDEQRIIVDYLDNAFKIYNNIELILENQLTNLKKYKESLIYTVSTRGIRNTTLTKSNLGWIKQIPSHWEVQRISSVFDVRSETVSDQDYEPLSVTMQGILPQLSHVAKTDDGDNRKLVKKGDFVINSRSDRRGACGISPMDGSVSLINIVLKNKIQIEEDYYNYLFRSTGFSDEFYKWGYGIVDDLWSTNWDRMKKIKIPIPPISEQSEITTYLDEKLNTINNIIKNKEKQIEVLSNKKKILLYECVTGVRRT